MEVDIIIPAYNSHSYIERCLESVFSQTLKPNRVIVVDDGSSPPLLESLSKFGESIILIRLNNNSGVSIARNKGIELAEGEYLAFLDSDDYWESEFLNKTFSFLQKHPETVAVSTGTRVKSWNGKENFYPKYPYIIGEIPEYGIILENFFKFWAETFSIMPGTLLMRSDAVKKIGGMRTDLILCEDLEFWGLLATYGLWGFIPEPLFVTDQRAVTPSERLKKLTSRYKSFSGMSVVKWGSRIKERLPEKYADDFRRVEAHIATTIAVAHAYSFRFNEAWQESTDWKPYLEKGLGSWLRLGVNLGKSSWPFICGAIRLREIIKAYVY